MITKFNLYENFKPFEGAKENDWIILKKLYPYRNASDIELIKTVQYKIGKVFLTCGKTVWIKYYEPLPQFTRTVPLPQFTRTVPYDDDKNVSVIKLDAADISKAFVSKNKKDLQKILRQDQFDL